MIVCISGLEGLVSSCTCGSATIQFVTPAAPACSCKLPNVSSRLASRVHVRCRQLCTYHQRRYALIVLEVAAHLMVSYFLHNCFTVCAHSCVCGWVRLLIRWHVTLHAPCASVRTYTHRHVISAYARHNSIMCSALVPSNLK